MSASLARVLGESLMPLPWYVPPGAFDTDQTCTTQTCGRHTKIEGIMLNITYKHRKTNIWVRERKKSDIISNVRKMKWSRAGHINRLKDDRWTSSVTTWRPYDKKRRQGRPAKRWRDDLDKYWSDTIWRRTAQDRLPWRQHAEAFAHPRALRLPNVDDDDDDDDDDDFSSCSIVWSVILPL